MFTYEDLHKLIDEDCQGYGWLLSAKGMTCMVGEMLLRAGVSRAKIGMLSLPTGEQREVLRKNWPVHTLVDLANLMGANDDADNLAARRQILHKLVKTFEERDSNGR